MSEDVIRTKQHVFIHYVQLRNPFLQTRSLVLMSLSLPFAISPSTQAGFDGWSPISSKGHTD